MKSNKLNWILTIVGLAILVVALILIKRYAIDSVLLYLCIGIGCGVFGNGFGKIINQWSRKQDPLKAQKMDIEQKDERNVAILNKSQAKAYNIMIFVFGALIMAFGLMGVDIKEVLMLVAAYLFVCGSSIYYNIKYSKEM